LVNSTISEFAYGGQKVDREFYTNVLEKFLERISRVETKFTFLENSTINEFAYAGQKVDREFHMNVLE
jgi:hypothetical protein